MSLLNDSGWSYDNSSGVAATYGEIVEVTAGHACIYIRSPQGDTYKVSGTGFGGGFGLSLLPGSITASATSLVSTGTSIYSFGDSLDISDFGSFMVLYNASAVGTIGGGTGTVAFFVHLNAWQKIKLAGVALSPLGIIGVLADLTSSFKAVCLFMGTEYTTPNLGLDATGTAYWISGTEQVS
ncbi:MAG TPA: hypothetical protein VGI38_09725 [Puia sp.]|jgi:hypothetical protein